METRQGSRSGIGRFGAHLFVLAAPLLGACLGGCLGGSERPPCSPPSAPGELGSICGFHGPEDLEHVPRAGLVVVSNLRLGGSGGMAGGFLSAFVPGADAVAFRLWPSAQAVSSAPEPRLGDPTCTVPPETESFAPHGLTSTDGGGRVLLYVVAHANARGAREAIEIFEMRGHGVDARLAWKACIPTPGAIQANDVVVSPEDKIVVSNYQPDPSIRHMLKSALLGSLTGNVLEWAHETGWRMIPGSEARMANGVALARRGELVLFSETMSGKVHRLPLDGSGGAISVDVGGNPDNFTRTPRGTLLVATHTGGAGFLLCSFGRSPCKTSWEVHELDPDTLAIKKLMEHDGSIVGAVATALEVNGLVYLGSVFDDRIGVIATSPR